MPRKSHRLKLCPLAQQIVKMAQAEALVRATFAHEAKIYGRVAA